DRRLGQRRVDRGQAHPGEGDQETIGDEAGDRREGRARRDRPRGHAQDEQAQDDVVERDGHAGGFWRQAARARAGDGIARVPRTRSHTAMSLTPSRPAPTLGRRPSTTRPGRRLSAWVRAWPRVSASGKRSTPTVPARKNTPPADTATTVRASR